LVEVVVDLKAELHHFLVVLVEAARGQVAQAAQEMLEQLEQLRKEPKEAVAGIKTP
jgi:hypothetical protein